MDSITIYYYDYYHIYYYCMMDDGTMILLLGWALSYMYIHIYFIIII